MIRRRQRQWIIYALAISAIIALTAMPLIMRSIADASERDFIATAQLVMRQRAALHEAQALQRRLASASRSDAEDPAWLPRGAGPKIASQLQDQVKRLFEEHHAIVQSIQIMPPHEEAGAQRLGVHVDARLQPAQLGPLLVALSRHRTPLWVLASLDVRGSELGYAPSATASRPSISLRADIVGYQSGLQP